MRDRLFYIAYALIVMIALGTGAMTIGSGPASAQGVPISGLPPAPSPQPSDIVPVTATRAGVKATYAMSLAQLQYFLFSGAAILPAKGQATCSMASSTNCTATVTVLAGATCTASYDAASTAAVATLEPLTVSLASTTLSIRGQVSGSAVSTAFTFDFICL